jgi:hypothetical protein
MARREKSKGKHVRLECGFSSGEFTYDGAGVGSSDRSRPGRRYLALAGGIYINIPDRLDSRFWPAVYLISIRAARLCSIALLLMPLCWRAGYLLVEIENS